MSSLSSLLLLALTFLCLSVFAEPSLSSSSLRTNEIDSSKGAHQRFKDALQKQTPGSDFTDDYLNSPGKVPAYRKLKISVLKEWNELSNETQVQLQPVYNDWKGADTDFFMDGYVVATAKDYWVHEVSLTDKLKMFVLYQTFKALQGDYNRRIQLLPKATDRLEALQMAIAMLQPKSA